MKTKTFLSLQAFLFYFNNGDNGDNGLYGLEDIYDGEIENEFEKVATILEKNNVFFAQEDTYVDTFDCINNIVTYTPEGLEDVFTVELNDDNCELNIPVFPIIVEQREDSSDLPSIYEGMELISTRVSSYNGSNKDIIIARYMSSDLKGRTKFDNQLENLYNKLFTIIPIEKLEEK